MQFALWVVIAIIVIGIVYVFGYIFGYDDCEIKHFNNRPLKVGEKQ